MTLVHTLTSSTQTQSNFVPFKGQSYILGGSQLTGAPQVYPQRPTLETRRPLRGRKLQDLEAQLEVTMSKLEKITCNVRTLQREIKTLQDSPEDLSTDTDYGDPTNGRPQDLFPDQDLSATVTPHNFSGEPDLRPTPAHSFYAPGDPVRTHTKHVAPFTQPFRACADRIRPHNPSCLLETYASQTPNCEPYPDKDNTRTTIMHPCGPYTAATLPGEQKHSNSTLSEVTQVFNQISTIIESREQEERDLRCALKLKEHISGTMTIRALRQDKERGWKRACQWIREIERTCPRDSVRKLVCQLTAERCLRMPTI